MGTKPLSLQQIHERIQTNHSGTVALVDSTYTKIHAKATFIDIEYGEFTGRVDHISSGGRHPKRCTLIRKTTPRIIVEQRLMETHGTLVVLGHDYQKYAKKCTFIDVEYGEWISTPRSVCKGTTHPKRWRNKLHHHFMVPRSEMEQRLFNIHGDTIKLGDDYRGTNTDCTFIDVKFGAWKAQPGHILGGMSHRKRKQSKMAKACRNHPTIFHWKTDEACHSQSSWEFATLLYLNKNQIDFDWQIPVETPFITTRRKQKTIYFIDLYIKSGEFANEFIEIKGSWYRTTSKYKWDWFHDHYTNSRLWMQKDLTDLGIIAKGKPNPILLDWYAKSQAF